MTPNEGIYGNKSNNIKGKFMARDWKKFDNDEIMTIWKGYVAQEFGRGDPLCLTYHHPKPIRLTPMEIIKLVDELMDRLDFKENPSIQCQVGGKNEMD